MREVEGWDQSPYQWATTGYNGAINTGKTICGALFGGAVVLGYLHGKDAKEAPDVKDKRRVGAMESVKSLFNGFMEQFGDTDCQTITGCDWSKKEDRDRYFKDKVYKDKCYKYVEYVIARCLDQRATMEQAE